MRAIYENDPVRGPGYGLVCLEDAGTESQDVRFAVIRSGDHKTLHPDSWEDTEHRLTPDGVSVRGGQLCLAVGPKVVRQLDELNTYRFVLFPPSGGPVKALLELSGIIYPPEDGMGLVGTAPKTPAAPIPAPPPPPEPEPEPELSSLPSLAPAPAPAKKPFPVWLLVLLVLLLAGGGAGAFFMLRDKPAAPPVAETPAEKPAENKEEPKQETPSADVKEAPAKAETPPAAPPAPLSPMDQARQFLRGNGSAAEGLALSRGLPQTPDGRDAAYLLLEAAADKGQPEAMLALGAFYDPVDTTAKGSILPDAEVAWMWYDKAEKAGQADAAARKKALRAWLEAEAGKGSATARTVLSRIK